MGNLNPRTTYFNVEIGRSYRLERAETCPPEHEHLTPVDAMICLRKNKRGEGVLAAAGEFRAVRRLTPEENAEIDRYVESPAPSQGSSDTGTIRLGGGI